MQPAPPLSIAVVSVFPDRVASALDCGVVARAREDGLWQWHGIALHDHGLGARRTIDTRPLGGGPGMLLRADVLEQALAAADRAHGHHATRVVLTPDGLPLTQKLVETLSSKRALTLVAGRYEGFDDAWLLQTGAIQVSIGDYVLSGGELAAAVVIDAVVRILPGVLGSSESAELDSFSTGLLDYPNFAQEPKPLRSAPAMLLHGHHGEVERWRRQQALLRTLERRPDLFARLELSPQDQVLLREALRESRRWV